MYDETHHDNEVTVEETTTEAPEAVGSPVVVRRNAAVAAVIGAAASAIAIGYLWRAVQTGSPLDWVFCLVVGLVAGFHLAGLLDARTPLVVADGLGVRIRLGAQWRGLPWDAVAAVEVQPRQGLLRDGRLVFRPHSVERALDGLEAPGRRSARLNERLYGAPLAVPLGLTTRTSSPLATLADDLVRLADERTTVALREAETTHAADSAHADAGRVEDPEGTRTPEVHEHAGPETAPDLAAPRAPRRSLVGGLGTIVSRVAKGRVHDVDRAAHAEAPEAPEGPDAPGGPAPAALAVPLRETRRGLRAEVTRDVPATVLGATALHQDAGDSRTGPPERRELRRPGSVDLVFEPVPTVQVVEPGHATVRPIAQLADPVEPLVIAGLAGAEPVADPVIGPQLAAARTRVGLTVDELADRTRIRPHVIESIEVDDFAPCGGDFYARGHLRTLARVLGQDPQPLLERFDNRYATAPINARRVFEAELATGMTGSMRSTVGGPNWALLVGCVLSLVLVWGVVRLFSTETADVDDSLLPGATPVLNGSAGVDREFPGGGGAKSATPARKRLPVTLVAAQAGTRVVVRDREGAVVFAGPLVMGERKQLRAVPPVRVMARNAGAVEVRVQGKDRGPVGELGQPGRRTFHRPR